MTSQMPQASRRMSNLQVRVLSAVLLGAAAVWATWHGGLPFRFMVALGGLLVYWEWQSITGYDKYGLLELAAPASVAASMFLVMAEFPALESVIPAIFATLFAIAAAVRRGVTYWFPLGVPYAILPVLGLTELRGASSSGLAAVVFLFCVVWATDIFAYVAGRALGGPKLAPSISPNKTWSGAIGGSLAGALAGAGAALWQGQANVLFFAAVALGLTLCAQAGDLFESYVKRRFGVKDSGTIIPGHGGVMDRVDGLIAATIALYLFCALSGFGRDPALALFN